jgi:hypothetical protein
MICRKRGSQGGSQRESARGLQRGSQRESARGSKVLGAVAVLAACASLTCGGDDGTGGDRVLRGVVYTTEPVVGARVTVRSLFNDFAYCTGVQTADDGSFTCPILAGDDGNWYVVAEGGAGLPAGTTLRGGVLDVVPLEERTITVSPVSDLAVALADARVAAGKDPDRIAAYHTAVALFDAHWDTDPFDADVKDLSAPSSLDDGAKLTLAIHGLAQLAAQAAVEQGVAAGSLTQLQLLALLRQDVAAPGEVFDGEGGALRLGTCADGLFLCEVGADSLRGYLGGAILAFARTPANGTGLGRDDLLTWLERLRTNAEPQLFGAAAVGPFDPLAPTVSWAAPSEGTTFTAGQSIAIDVSAADANGVASVTVEVVGATATVTDTDPSPERFVAMVPVAGLPEGPLTLTAIARDLDDNTASASRGVVIDQVSGGTISGTVTKGRVAGATVTAYRYGNGARGAAVGTGTTDAMGNLTNLLVADGTAGPILLEATGGSYAEDAQPATSVTLDVADRLRTVIPAYTDGASLSTVQLTPLTELAVAYLEYLTSTSTGGADLAARWATAHGAIEAHFGVSNVRDVTPSTPAQVDTLAANDRYGLVLLGISRAAWRASAAGGGDAGAFGSAVNGYAVTRAWARDLGDGCWDGRAGTTMLTYGGVTPLTAEAARLHLAQAIVDYLGDGARNQTTFTTAADVLPLLDTVALAATSAPGACAGGALFATPGRPFDREPPVITFGAFPATDPFVRGTFDVTATATDNLDTEPSLTFTSGQTDIDIDRSEVRATIATAALPDGALTIGLASQDDSGNAATATRTVTVDNTAPAVTITAPALAGGVYRTLNVAWTTVEPNVAATTAEVDGVAIVNGGGVSAEGPHTLTVTVDDRAGNRTTVTRAFTIDTAAPTISLTAPADGAHVRGPVTLTFAATDANPGATATATLDGAPITSPHTLNVEGPHTLVVNATDAAGNPAAAVTRTFTIDNTAPTLTVTAPASGSFVRGPVTPTFSATDNLPPATVSATLDGNPFLSGTPINTEGQPHPGRERGRPGRQRRAGRDADLHPRQHRAGHLRHRPGGRRLPARPGDDHLRGHRPQPRRHRHRDPRRRAHHVAPRRQRRGLPHPGRERHRRRRQCRRRGDAHLHDRQHRPGADDRGRGRGRRLPAGRHDQLQRRRREPPERRRHAQRGRRRHRDRGVRGARPHARGDRDRSRGQRHVGDPALPGRRHRAPPDRRGTDASGDLRAHARDPDGERRRQPAGLRRRRAGRGPDVDGDRGDRDQQRRGDRRDRERGHQPPMAATLGPRPSRASSTAPWPRPST